MRTWRGPVGNAGPFFVAQNLIPLLLVNASRTVFSANQGASASVGALSAYV